MNSPVTQLGFIGNLLVMALLSVVVPELCYIFASPGRFVKSWRAGVDNLVNNMEFSNGIFVNNMECSGGIGFNLILCSP